MSYDTGLWGNNREGIGAFYFGEFAFSVSADSDTLLNFVNNDITFSAVSALSGTFDPSWTLTNTFDFKNGVTSATTSPSVLYGYPQQGTYSNVGVESVITNASDVALVTSSDYSLTLRINPLPSIYFTGIPAANSAVSFQDNNGGNYFTGTVVSADWNFGDGFTSGTTDLTATIDHSYSSVGTYSVSVSAYDVSGNIGVSTTSFSVLEGETCKAKEDYITICGPDMLGRYGDCRNINLRDYLPNYLRGGETEEFLGIFENFLNNMFDGLCGWQTSANELTVAKDWSVSSSNTVSASVNRNFTYDLCGTDTPTDASNAEQIEIHWPSNASYPTSAQKISILEKAHRLTELHDPDLIDIEYIQFFAANLGYNVNVSRDEAGLSGTTEGLGTTEINDVCSSSDVNRYLRFVVRNLPTWYKIKTTRNSIKVLLYSFGLIGDLQEYFTNNYKSTSAGGRWRLDEVGDLSEIENNWFPTPHFAIRLDFDTSSDISFDISRRQKVIRAIESIRPINTVFRRLMGYVNRVINLGVAGYIRMTRYMVIESDGYSNGWE